VNGLGEPYPSAESESGIAEAIAILGWVLVQSFALIFADKHPEGIPLDSPIVWIYAGSALLVMGAVVGLLNATKIDGNNLLCRTYNRGTLVYCRYVLWLSPLVLFSFLGLGVAGMLPLQRPVDDVSLTPVKIDNHRFSRDGVEGIEVHFTLSPEDYSGPLPNTLYLDVQFSGGLEATWKLASVFVYAGEADRINLLPFQPAMPHDSVRGNVERVVKVPLTGLQASGMHTIVLNIRPRDGSKNLEKVQSAIKLIQEQQAVEAVIRRPNNR